MKLFERKTVREGQSLGLRAFVTWVNHSSSRNTSIHIRWPIRVTREITDPDVWLTTLRRCVLIWSFRWFHNQQRLIDRLRFERWWKTIDEFDKKKYRREQIAFKRQGKAYDSRI